MPAPTRRVAGRAASCGAALPDRRESLAALAHHLRAVHGYEAVHVNEIGLQGVSDPDVLARAVAEDRIVVTNNAEDFRQLGRRTPDHPGLRSCSTRSA